MNSRWIQLECLAKGVCLGFLALLATVEPDWRRTAIFYGITLGTLVLTLIWTGWQTVRAGHTVRGRFFTFLLYVLLENPTRVYGGIFAGMVIGIAVQVYGFGQWQGLETLYAVVGGVAIGIAFLVLRQLTNRWARAGVVLVLGAGAAVGAIYALKHYSPYLGTRQETLLATHILLAVPLLYLLTFAGRAEETELEIGTICVALGVALWILLPESSMFVAVLAPLALYVVYTQRVLLHLKVFKHVLRGINYTKLEMYRESLLAYRRALQLDPANEYAKEGRWRVHKEMDFSKVKDDPGVMSLVNLDLCLDRAGELLLRSSPTPHRLEEAHKLLDLVAEMRPMMLPAVRYWRAVAFTHAREYDKAETEIRHVLDDTNYAPDDAYRESVLMACWQLVLLQSPELKERVGIPLLAQEGRRLDAIAAVERPLAESGDSAGGAWDLKRFLYEGLTEAEYRVRAGPDRRLPAAAFDHNYCGHLGMSLLSVSGDDAAEACRRGAEYLRIAAFGVPERSPAIYYQIAEACVRAGDADSARRYREMVKLAARELGVKNLSAEDQQSYFYTVRELGEAAYEAGDYESAIENLSLYLESKDAGLDTVRLLTELYERKGDAMGALLMNEKALVFDSKNKLFLERKDKYYYSVTPADMAARPEAVQKLFDVDYCLKKAKSLLDAKGGGPDQVDWAAHLLQLAAVLRSNSIPVLVLTARAKLRQGDEEEALPLLEQARANKPESFASAEESEAWYWANAKLADIYLKALGKPDLALACLSDYRKYAKSGADTLFKMGQAYEMLGDRVRAAKCYEHVKIYDHPLAADAHMALQRLASG